MEKCQEAWVVQQPVYKDQAILSHKNPFYWLPHFHESFTRLSNWKFYFYQTWPKFDVLFSFDRRDKESTQIVSSPSWCN